MNLKVHLTSPYEDGTDIKQWFALMRVALKAAEKTYEEKVKGLTEKQIENVFIRFSSEFMVLPEVRKIEDNLDDHYCKSQEVWLEINEIKTNNY